MKRHRLLSVRISPQERELLDAAARMTGEEASSYVRRIAPELALAARGVLPHMEAGHGR